MWKLFVLALVIALLLTWPARLSPTIKHPVLAMQAMWSFPVGSRVVPLLEERMWCRDYQWGCGHPATVIGYKIVTDLDQRPLLVYTIRTDNPLPAVIDVHPFWVIKLGL